MKQSEIKIILDLTGGVLKYVYTNAAVSIGFIDFDDVEEFEHSPESYYIDPVSSRPVYHSDLVFHPIDHEVHDLLHLIEIKGWMEILTESKSIESHMRVIDDSSFQVKYTHEGKKFYFSFDIQEDIPAFKFQEMSARFMEMTNEEKCEIDNAALMYIAQTWAEKEVMRKSRGEAFEKDSMISERQRLISKQEKLKLLIEELDEKIKHAE